MNVIYSSMVSMVLHWEEMYLNHSRTSHFNEQNIQGYMTKGVERVVKDALTLTYKMDCSRL